MSNAKKIMRFRTDFKKLLRCGFIKKSECFPYKCLIQCNLVFLHLLFSVKNIKVIAPFKKDTGYFVSVKYNGTFEIKHQNISRNGRISEWTKCKLEIQTMKLFYAAGYFYPPFCSLIRSRLYLRNFGGFLFFTKKLK